MRFTRHNAEFEAADNIWKPEWNGLKDKWFDEEYQIDKFMTQVHGKHYQGETFPVFWPNLGPQSLPRSTVVPSSSATSHPGRCRS